MKRILGFSAAKRGSPRREINKNDIAGVRTLKLRLGVQWDIDFIKISAKVRDQIFEGVHQQVPPRLTKP
jgi:hypothetical protein